MDKVTCWDNNSSTTRILSKEKPALDQKPEYKLKPKLFLLPNSQRKGEGGLRFKGLFKKSYKNKPLISVVTVVYNGEKYLAQTINSVLEQNYDNVEYVVIDGGSTDRTIDIIRRYEDKIDYWVSEPDRGIYDAMNKGTALATGKYIAFLNADDWYPVETLETVAAGAEEAVSYIFGDMDLYDEETFTGKRIPYHYKYGTPIGHQALFVKTDIMRIYPFNIKYNIAADYDLMLKLIVRNYRGLRVDATLANFRIAGVSSISYFDKENFLIYRKHFGLFPAIIFYIRNTKHPLVSGIVQELLKVKKQLIGKGNRDD